MTRTEEYRHVDRRPNVHTTSLDLDVQPARLPKAGTLNSSRLPLPSQLSQLSTDRPPDRLSKESDGAQGFQPADLSASETLTATTKSRSDLTERRRHEQEDRPKRRYFDPSAVQGATSTRPLAIQSTRSQIGLSPRKPKTEVHPKSSQTYSTGPKPLFSTYQRQFTPKKPKSQSTTETLHARRSLGDGADADHVTNLQDELLQLRWIYRYSESRLQRWVQSGQSSIEARRRQHAQKSRQVMSLEQAQHRNVNGKAFEDRLVLHGGQRSFGDIVSLSQCVQTLTDLTRPRGDFCHILKQFESWYMETTSILEERSDTTRAHRSRFIEPLEEPWAETVLVVIQSSRSCLRRLEELEPFDPSSGIGLVLDGHLRLAKGLLDELNSMQAIHSTVLDQEEDWIGRQAAAVLTPDKGYDSLAAGLYGRAAWDRPV